jgi:hypothetical protein
MRIIDFVLSLSIDLLLILLGVAAGFGLGYLFRDWQVRRRIARRRAFMTIESLGTRYGDKTR